MAEHQTQKGTDATEAVRRYWVSALIGPCTEKEATEFTEEMAEVSDHILPSSLGAAWGFQAAEDD